MGRRKLTDAEREVSKAKVKAYMKTYNATDEAKARRKAGQSTPEYKAKAKTYLKTYAATDEYRAKKKFYYAKDECKARAKKYYAARYIKTGNPTSDNNVIYIWEAIDEFFNGEQVYKIGVTSARLGEARIHQCAKKSGKDANVLILENVNGKATDIEAEILKLGEDPKYIECDGYTEFRALNNDDLDKALDLIITRI